MTIRSQSISTATLIKVNPDQSPVISLREHTIEKLLDQIKYAKSIIPFEIQLRQLSTKIREELVNRSINRGGDTLLHQAARKNKVEEVKLLLELNANVNLQNQQGN